MSEKRLAIVTGGARGIGRAIVYALAEQGRKILVIDINDEMLAECAKLGAEKGLRNLH